jgi:hypothetical protein
MAKARITTKVDANTRPFERKMDRAGGRAKQFKGQMGAVGKSIIGAFAVGAVVAFHRKIVNVGSALSDLADNSAVSTDFVQVITELGKEAGAAATNIENSLLKTRQAQGKALEGAVAMQKAFATLGVTQEDLGKMNTEQVYQAVARGLRDANGSAESFVAMQQIIGVRAGPKMLTALLKLADEGLPALTKGLKDAGQIMDEQTIKQLDQMADAAERVNTKFTVWGANLQGKFLGGLYIAGKAMKGMFTGDIEGELAEARKMIFGDEGIMTKAAADAEAKRNKIINDNKNKPPPGDPDPDPDPDDKPDPVAKVAWKQRGPVSNLRRVGAGFGQAPTERLSQQQLAQLKKLVEISSKQYVADLQTADNTAQPNLSILG